MKLVLLDGFTTNPGDLSFASLEKFGELTTYDRTPFEKAAERIGDAELALTNKVPIGENEMAQCKNLRYIGLLSTGYNVIDLAAARRHNITVCNVPSYSTDAVAQAVFAMLLSFTNQVDTHSREVMAGDWCRTPDFCFYHMGLSELAGKQIGIIGFGRIGKRAAEIAKAFGMTVAVHTRREPQILPEGVTLLPLEELLESSDVVTLHIPLFPETEHLICKETLALMKKGAILINTARGPVVNEQDVADALRDGTLGGYAADVVSVEPMREDNPLLGAPNCVVTPHIAWAAKETRERLLRVVEQNIEAFLAGTPQNVVE